MARPALKSIVPWWGRIPAKIALAWLPIGSKRLKRLGLFHHGAMESVEYAAGVFDFHLAAYRRVTGGTPPPGFAALELGPGDSLFSALLARGAGASRTLMVDVGDFAQRDPGLYEAMARYVNGRPGRKIEVAGEGPADELVAACGGEYLTQGLESLMRVPAGSVDFAWSHAVLHAVRRAEFRKTIGELRRIMRAGGICSHEIDLRDMLGGSLNHLRFSQAAWERDIVARAGFYANRLRYSEMLQIFRDCGFEVLLAEPRRWDRLPVPRRKLYASYRELPDEELRTHGCHVVLRSGG